MSDVRKHSEFDYSPPPPQKKRKGKARCPYYKILIDWVRSGRTGKYSALGHGARTLLRMVRTPWPRVKYFPVRPLHSVNTYIVCVSVCVCVCSVFLWQLACHLVSILFFLQMYLNASFARVKTGQLANSKMEQPDVIVQETLQESRAKFVSTNDLTRCNISLW